jgi:hypothetical protein
MNVVKDIEFSPALIPGKLAASRERHAGHGAKSWALVSGVPEYFFGPAVRPTRGSVVMKGEMTCSR